MVIDFRKQENDPEAILIKEKEVERVETFKYPGFVLNKNNIDVIISKIKTRMYCLRELRSFNVNPNLLQIFYSSLICNVLSFAFIFWGGNIKKQHKDRLNKIVRKAGGIVGKK